MSSDSGCTDSVNSELVGVTAAAGQFSYLLEVHPDAAFASLRFRDFTTETLFILIDDVYVGPPEPEGVFFDDFESGSDCRWAP
jgi:hypothetical protein